MAPIKQVATKRSRRIAMRNLFNLGVPISVFLKWRAPLIVVHRLGAISDGRSLCGLQTAGWRAVCVRGKAAQGNCVINSLVSIDATDRTGSPMSSLVGPLDCQLFDLKKQFQSANPNTLESTCFLIS